jgi:hypothetical protein
VHRVAAEDVRVEVGHGEQLAVARRVVGVEHQRRALPVVTKEGGVRVAEEAREVPGVSTWRGVDL